MMRRCVESWARYKDAGNAIRECEGARGGGSEEANRAMRSGAIMPRVKRSAQVTAQRKERRAGRLELSPLFYSRGIITTATADAIFI